MTIQTEKNNIKPKGRVGRKSTKVIQYSHTGEFIKEFESVTKASEELGIGQTMVTATISKPYLTYNSKYNLRKEGVEPQDLLEGNRIVKYDKYGKPLGVYDFMEDAFESIGVTYDSKIYKGEKKICGDYQFVRESSKPSLVSHKNCYVVNEVNPDNTKGIEITHYDTLEEVGKFLGVTRERVRQVVKSGIPIRGYYITSVDKSKD